MTILIDYTQDEHFHWIVVDILDQKTSEVIEVSLSSSNGDQISKMKLLGPKHRVDISHIKINTVNVKVVTKNATVLKVLKIGRCIEIDHIT